MYCKLTKSILMLVAMFALGCMNSVAQTIFGSLTGDVLDSSGGAIAGATVTIREINTGIERRITTDSSGAWKAPSLAIGQYEVTATAPGLEKVVQSPISVDAATERKIEFSLKPSAQGAVVNINSQSPLIEATKSQLSGEESGKEALELPTGGNTDVLAKLMAGVSQNNPSVCCSHYSVNGSSERSQHYTIDNADNNDPGSTGAYVQLPAEDIQEYHLVTNNYSAEFGRNSGSVAQFITKSGTNAFHGIETWTFNGPALNAFSTSAKRTFDSYIAEGLSDGAARRLSVAGFANNTVLLSVGGPIQRNKMFFFTSWDQSISATSAQPTATVITPAGMQLLQQNQSSFAPGVLSFLQQTYPLANTPTSEGSLTVTLPNGSPLTVPLGVYNAGLNGAIPYKPIVNRGLGKFDRKFSDSDTFSMRYLIYDYYQIGAPQALPINREGGALRDQNVALNEVHIFSPNLIGESRVDYVRYASGSIGDFNIGSFNIGGSGLPTIGYSNQPQGRWANIYEGAHTLTWTKGNHSMRMGGSYLLYQVYSIYAPYSYGYVTYPSFQNFLFDQTASYTKFGGNGVLRALTDEVGLFFNDDWRVTRNLTLNLGVRWEYQSAPDKYFSNATADPKQFSPHLGFAYSPHRADGLLGKLFGDGKSAIRGGFALSYDNIFQTLIVETARNYPRGLAVTLPSVSGQEYFNYIYNKAVAPQSVSPSQFTGNSELLNDFVFSPNHEIRPPYAEQMNFGIERQLSKDSVLKVFYVGTHGVHLLRTYEGNLGIFQSAVQANPSTYATVLPTLTLSTDPATGLPAYIKNPNAGPVDVADSIGFSEYHSLQVTLSKRFSRGLQFNLNYTYSAFINDGDGEDSQNFRGYPSVPWNWENDKARSSLDQPQRLVINSLYEIPDFARGTKFSRATGGWELGGIFTYGSGTPYNIFNAYDALGILADPFATYAIGGISNAQRPTYNPNGTPGTGSSPNVANPMYIANATNSGIIGNLGGNTMHLGTTTDLDMQVLKSVRAFRENQRMQLFASITDIFNHRNFTALPANIVSSSTNNTTFLNLGYTNVVGRAITLGARIIF
jgi:outer membrane receptor protein involved in Fe transport